MAPINVVAIRNWLKSQYPNPELNPEWIQTTVAALQEDDPTLDLRGMFFAIQTQLLLSNLEQSVLPQPLYPIPGKLSTLPQEPSLVHDIFLYGPEKKDAILLQIVSISEVGHSAFQTKNTMELRKEALSGVGRIRRIRDHMGPGEGNRNNVNGDQQPDEEDNEPDDVPPYPRSMLMLDVSDGYRVMRAMEYKRIDALKLGETALGCKLLLRNVKVRRGIRGSRYFKRDTWAYNLVSVLLTPENTEVKGHMVEEFEELQPILFQNGLLRRMGKPELPVELEAVPEPRQPEPASEFDADLSDGFVIDETVANELDRVEAAASQASQSQTRPTAYSQSMASAAVPITPSRPAAGNVPATRSGMPVASSSSLNAAVRTIDLDRSDDLEDPLADADVDWNAIDEIELSFSQSQSQNNSARSNPGKPPAPVASAIPATSGISSRSIVSIRSDTSEYARAATQSQARSKARSQGRLSVSEDDSSEDERKAAVRSNTPDRRAALRKLEQPFETSCDRQSPPCLPL